MRIDCLVFDFNKKYFNEYVPVPGTTPLVPILRSSFLILDSLSRCMMIFCKRYMYMYFGFWIVLNVYYRDAYVNQVNPSSCTVAHSYSYTLHRFKMRTLLREVCKSFLHVYRVPSTVPRTLYEQLLSFWRRQKSQSHKSLRVIPSASLGEKLECESKE